MRRHLRGTVCERIRSLKNLIQDERIPRSHTARTRVQPALRHAPAKPPRPTPAIASSRHLVPVGRPAN